MQWSSLQKSISEFTQKKFYEIDSWFCSIKLFDRRDEKRRRNKLVRLSMSATHLSLMYTSLPLWGLYTGRLLHCRKY